MTKKFLSAAELRAAVAQDRSIAFDIASRALACVSPMALAGHERKVRERHKPREANWLEPHLERR